MITLRPLNWPDDRAALLALDTTFVADRFYRLEQKDRAMSLEETVAASPVHKAYPLTGVVDALPTIPWVQIAADGDAVVGLAAMRFEQWNRRGRLEHLYVAPPARGRGIGRMLVESAMDEARRLGARGVWVETQNTNYGAIRYYERAGFAWCGLDTSLYDPDEVPAGEIAVFLWREVKGKDEK